jgi:patatin-like phospholipase/acyl hydrolase
MKKILAIDGGGIKGILPAKILAYLEEEKRKTNPNYHLSDTFDLIAGTSTGGIIALALLMPAFTPSTNNNQYSASDLVKLYENNGKGIFNTNFLRKFTSNLYNETYNISNLEKYLKAYFKDTQLKQLLKPCLITAYDIYDNAAWFFNQRDAAQNDSYNFFVRDVARATSAAPTYFETAEIQSLSGVRYPLVDGGVFANNPAACALVEMVDILDTDANVGNIQILSIGTGVKPANEKKYTHNMVKNWGKIQWAAPAINIMMQGNSQTVHYQLKTIYSSINKEDNYIRLQPTINMGSTEMDDASAANIDGLLQDAGRFITENQDQLNHIVANIL